jgi:DNA-binding transcriptional LysR family regulator
MTGPRWDTQLEIRELEAFVLVSEELHFGRAAARLHVTPSRVSQAVRRLERRVGGPLFERTSRRVRLTPLGQSLLDEVRPALAQLEGALRQARDVTRLPHEPLQVGFPNSLPDRLAAMLTSEFWRVHQEIPVVRYAAPTLDYLDWLEEDHDGVFMSWFPLDPRELHLPRLRFGPAVMRAQRAALVAGDHPLAARTGIDAEELAEYDVMYPPHPPELGQRFADSWTPPVTPSGRPIRRLRRASGRLLEAWLPGIPGRHAAPSGRGPGGTPARCVMTCAIMWPSIWVTLVGSWSSMRRAI